MPEIKNATAQIESLYCQLSTLSHRLDHAEAQRKVSPKISFHNTQQLLEKAFDVDLLLFDLGKYVDDFDNSKTDDYPLPDQDKQLYTNLSEKLEHVRIYTAITHKPV